MGIEVSPQTYTGWYFTYGYYRAGTRSSKPPTYATQYMLVNNKSLQ
jgi:hypothetical protein